MAGPFCALWAQGRRAAAHSGGPRPSRPASASLRPWSGRGPAGGPLGPGLGPALPTRRPRGLVLLTARQRDASPAGWWGLPSAPSGRVPPAPQRPAGRYPCPPWAAWAPPAPPACGGRGVVAAGRRLRRLRSAPLRGLPAASRCAGPPSRAARPSPLRGPLRGPCPPPAPRRLRRRCSGPPRPHSWGLLGRCGPPARACLAPASRPALARLRLCPRWRGSACARPSRRSGPAPLRRPAAEPRGGVRALWARPVRGRNLDAARKGLARVAGRGPIPRRARLWRGVAPPAGGSATSPTIRQGQDKLPAAGLV
jgi:hypothetical protein